VYEVRHTLTGRVIAFGHAAHVANALADLKLNGGVGTFARLFRKQPLVSRVSDLEYRTCAAASRAEARPPPRRGGRGAPPPRPPRAGPPPAPRRAPPPAVCAVCGRPPGAAGWTRAGRRARQAELLAIVFCGGRPRAGRFAFGVRSGSG
jgi:hypothetical protein